MKRKFLFSTTTLSVGLIGNLCGQDLVINGDFETGIVGSHTYAVPTEFGDFDYGPPTYGGEIPAPWTRGPAETRGWMITDVNADLVPGDFLIRLDANDVGNPNGQPETLRQSGINLRAGVEYAFSMDLAGSESLGAGVLVTLNGTGDLAGTEIVVGTFDDITEGGFQEVSVTFRPETTGEYELRMSATTTDNNHALVDNVSLVPNDSDELEITSIELDSDSASVTWKSLPGGIYAVNFSTDLLFWEELSDSVESEGEETSYDDVFADRFVPIPLKAFYQISRIN